MISTCRAGLREKGKLTVPAPGETRCRNGNTIVGPHVYRPANSGICFKARKEKERKGKRRLAYFRRLPDAAAEMVRDHLVEKDIGSGLGKIEPLGGALNGWRAHEIIERGVAHLLERQAFVVFGFHVLGILVMHLQEFQEAQLALGFVLVALVMLDQERYFGKLMQVRVRQEGAYQDKKSKEEDPELQFV
jgi:hypothetical protein